MSDEPLCNLAWWSIEAAYCFLLSQNNCILIYSKLKNVLFQIKIVYICQNCVISPLYMSERVISKQHALAECACLLADIWGVSTQRMNEKNK